VSESAGEKNLAPTRKRLTDAAKKGDVLRPRELGTAGVMLIGAAFLQVGGPWMLAAMGDALRLGLVWDRAALDDFTPGRTLLALIVMALPPVLVLGLLVIAVTLATQLAFGEGRFNGGNIAPKASRINPLSGLKRMFGPTGWIEIAKGLAKVALLGVIAWLWIESHLPQVLGLGRGELRGQLAAAWDAIVSLLYALAAGLTVIALIDFPVQWLRRFMRLRMSHQDMRDEHKETEGSPENKANVRQRQRQIAMGSINRSMREAQFVITNPTHFSVAMAYDPALAAAPVVLAKGRGEKALAIRELAAEYGVPVLEYPALARSVYYTTRERQVIREELFGAVAGVLAFVFSLKRGENNPMPPIEVPLALRFDADGRLDPLEA